MREKELSGENPRTVRGPYLQQGTESGIIIRWATDAPVQGRVVRLQSLTDFNTADTTITRSQARNSVDLSQTKAYYLVGKRKRAVEWQPKITS